MHSQNDKDIYNDSTTVDTEDDENRANDANQDEDTDINELQYASDTKVIITEADHDNDSEASDVTDLEGDKVKRAVSFDDSPKDNEKSKSTISSFHQVVEAARRASTQETSNDDNNDEIRPATCIPIITIDHVEDVDIHAKENREPKQTIYRDPVTGIQLQSMRNKMHHLSVPRKGRTSKFAEARPATSSSGHPALLSKKVRKPMGVKRIQYLIEQRQRNERRREKRRKEKENHKNDEAKKQWLRLDRLRLAQDAAVEHRNATVAWT